MSPPMMPPPMGGSPGSGAGAERPDSSGLLGNESEPWAPGVPDAGEPGGQQVPAGEPESWATPGPVTSKDGFGVDGGQLPPVVLPPMGGLPGGDDRGARRPDSAALLGNGSEPWAPDAGQPDGRQVLAGEPDGRQVSAGGPVSAPDASVVPGVPTEQPIPYSADPAPAWPEDEQDEPGDDRVAVVRPPEAEEDTAAWGVLAGAGALGFLVSPVRKATDEEERTEHAPDYALRESEPWVSGQDTPSTYRRKNGEVAVDDQPLLMCSAAPPPEPEEEPDDAPEAEDEDGEKERTAANLLQQSDDAWGSAKPAPGNGVLG
ncbi:hypothetical protein ACQPZF_25970 [Actinosynnema sp. CS-041913]|uniref:hypothetical protein n=1 Tax=Actinosynnema sp. CS-041913 TaxID=3239917 RepID=UPI003D8D994E